MKTIAQILVAVFLILNTTPAQTGNINNTIGAGGKFKVKDADTTFFQIDQFTKTTSIYGDVNINEDAVLKKSDQLFLHNSKADNSLGNNLFIGLNAGNDNLAYSGAIGNYSASFNTGVGYYSLNNLTNGYGNTAFGHVALRYNTTGRYNCAFGNLSLNSNTTGFGNSAFGTSSLQNNIAGYENSAFGEDALRNNINGGSNSAFGRNSLYFNTSASGNSAFGGNALYKNDEGFNNSAFGFGSMFNNTSGYQNTALGYISLYLLTTGHDNTAIGHKAGYNLTTGSNNIIIGFNAQPSSSTVSNQITLGNNQITQIRANVTSITSLSDQRDKKNIKELSLGLDFIMKLKPREFNWDKREWYETGNNDGSKMEDHPTAGFIAQELNEVQDQEQAVWLNLVSKDNPEKWEATYGNLLPVMVKAIQELKEENEKLAKENTELRKEISNVQTTIAEQVEYQLKSTLNRLINGEKEPTKVSLGE